MGGNQDHSRIGVEVSAKALLQALDPRLAPRVYFVGLLQEEGDTGEKLSICVSPDDCPIQPKMLEGWGKRAGEIAYLDPDNNVLHSHPVAQERFHARRSTRALIQALEERVRASPASVGWKTLVSWPSEVNGYQVFVVLQVQDEVWSDYTRLPKDQHDRVHIDTSLLDAAVDGLLSAAAEELRKPNPYVRDLPSAGEFLRRGARHLMLGVGYTVQVGADFHGLYETSGCPNMLLTT